MRRFRNFGKSEQQELIEMFPDIYNVPSFIDKDGDRITVEGYTYMGVTVFDHWLNGEEYEKHLWDVPKDEQDKRDAKFNLFAETLIENTEIINFVFRGRRPNHRTQFRKFISQAAKEQYLLISDYRFFRVALPQLEALYFEDWHDTTIFYLRNIKHVDLIRKWATECGLYCLYKP